MSKQKNRQSITIEDVVIYKDEIENRLARDVFDTLVTLSNDERSLNMNMMRVKFDIAGFSNTLVGLMNTTPVKGAINPDVDIEETGAFPPENT